MSAFRILALEELSPLAFRLSGHKDRSHTGVHQVHVSEKFVEGFRFTHLTMSHELICHLVTLLSHVHVVAQLFHCRLQHLSQPGTVLGKVVSDVGNCAVVVVDRRNVNVGVPVD